MGSDGHGAAAVAVGADPDDVPDLYGLAIARGSLVLRQWMVPSIDVVALSLACAAVVDDASPQSARSLVSIGPVTPRARSSTRAKRGRLIVGAVMIVALLILCLAFAAR